MAEFVKSTLDIFKTVSCWLKSQLHQFVTLIRHKFTESSYQWISCLVIIRLISAEEIILVT